MGQGKISNLKVIPAIILLLVGIWIIAQASIITTPVIISNKGVLISLVGVALIMASVRLFRKSVTKA